MEARKNCLWLNRPAHRQLTVGGVGSTWWPRCIQSARTVRTAWACADGAGLASLALSLLLVLFHLLGVGLIILSSFLMDTVQNSMSDACLCQMGGARKVRVQIKKGNASNQHKHVILSSMIWLAPYISVYWEHLEYQRFLPAIVLQGSTCYQHTVKGNCKI